MTTRKQMTSIDDKILVASSLKDLLIMICFKEDCRLIQYANQGCRRLYVTILK